MLSFRGDRKKGNIVTYEAALLPYHLGAGGMCKLPTCFPSKSNNTKKHIFHTIGLCSSTDALVAS